MTDLQEGTSRKAALAVLGAVVAIFILLSAASFAQDRGRPEPAALSFQGKTGVEGKQVFQAYNCMGCHTLLGNGAYFGPDLTKVYADGGPAWLLAFLSSPGSWPTDRVLETWIEQLRQSGDLDIDSPAAYYERYPHVKEAVELFGGKRTAMPNLAFRAGEIPALVAFFNYSAEIDTAGWPPARQADAGVIERFQARYGVVLPTGAAPTPTGAEITPTGAETTPTASQGEQLAGQLGCRACHSIDGSKSVGSTWKGLYGSTVVLSDGSTVTVDEAYLRESILNPNAKIVQGYASGAMPPYEGQLSPAELDALVAYIQSLK